MADFYVAEIVAYPSGGPVTTLYYATAGWTTLPTDTPASTFIDGRLAQPVNVHPRRSPDVRC